MPDLAWLDQKHAVYTANENAWRRDERRLRGGDEVLRELRPFMWETLPGSIRPILSPAAGAVGERTEQRVVGLENTNGEHYLQRMAQALYLNFPASFAGVMVGHLMKKAPQPGAGLDFGTMGDVSPPGHSGEPTFADLVWRNVDGVGIDASQWTNWWGDVYRRAMATGHRWILTEAPEGEGAPTKRQVIEGQRPYLTELSPLHVPFWHLEDGELALAITRVWKPQVKLEGNAIIGANPTDRAYLLMVAQGFDGLGGEYEQGGWWLFTPDREPMAGEDGHLQGRWDRTNGRIPMFPIFHERDQGSDDLPTISSGGLTELGQLAVSYMNLSSAADYDAWDAAGSVQYLLGATEEAYNLAVKMLKKGSKTVPLQADQSGNTPQVHDASAGAVASEVFGTRLAAKLEEARELAALGATSTPESSGRSKQAGFQESRSPRLANMATEMEAAQHMAIRFLEMRFGNSSPTGSVEWPTDFDLLEVQDEIERIFHLEALAGLRSPTVDGKLLEAALREANVSLDEETLAAAVEEYRQAAERRQGQADRMRTAQEEMESAFGG